MDQELDVLLDILEAGNIRDFRRMVAETEWDWLLCYFHREIGLGTPYVRLAGPLELAFDLSRSLSCLSDNRKRGINHTLAIGKLRRALNMFHLTPSMEHIRLTTSEYTKAVVRAVEYMCKTTGKTPRDSLKKILTTYILSSVDTSWCFVKYVANALADTASIPHINVIPDNHRIVIGHIDTSENGSILYWDFYSYGDWDRSVLRLQLKRRFNGAWSSSETVFSTNIRRHSSNNDLIETSWDLDECEQPLKKAGFIPYLTRDFLDTMDPMIDALAQYISWYGLRGREDLMPESEQPLPPTWLSVWKDVA